MHLEKFPALPMLAYTRSLLDGAKAWEQGDYDKAERCFTASLSQIKTELTPERFHQLSLGLLADLEYGRGNYHESLKYLHQSLEEAPAPDIRAALYNQLQRCYKAAGDMENSAYYLNRYVTLSDTLLRSGQSKALRDIEKQNSAAESDRRMSRANEERRGLVVMLVIILVALLVTVVLGIRLWVSRGKLKKANEELYRQTKERLTPTLPVAETPADAEPPVDEEEKLTRAMIRVMQTSEEVYWHDFGLDTLARLVDAPSRKVSQVINSRLGTNFSTFLQKYREEEACRRFDDRERYGRQTIEAISEGLGFKSRSNFVAVFKKYTGLTPSMYQKISASHPPKGKYVN